MCYVDMWVRGILSSGNSMCKGPEVGANSKASIGVEAS